MDTSDPAGAPGSASLDAGVASDTPSMVTSMTADVTEAAKLATRAVKEHATQFAAQVGHELSTTADDLKVRGVDALLGFARAINTAAAELESQSPLAARYARDAAEKVEGLSGNIRNRNVNELFHAAAEVAKSQPLLFFGSAMAAGFALARFLKSSTVAPSAGQSQEPAGAHGGR
jgi:hypothetical protein